MASEVWKPPVLSDEQLAMIEQVEKRAKEVIMKRNALRFFYQYFLSHVLQNLRL